MRAAVLEAYNEPLVIEDLAELPLGPREVRVQVEASGVCHSDLSCANGSMPTGAPLILGHEGTGTVLEIGTDVRRVAVGDRVVAAFIPACGECFFCLHDQSHLCARMGETAFAAKGTRADGVPVPAMTGLGTFSDVMTADETALVTVTTDLPPEQLALIGCGVTTGVGAALNTARVTPGSTVVVFGCGGVGQAVLQGARIAGAGRIIAVDPVELKRTVATTFGATDLIDPTDADPVEQVRALTDGRGADYAFEVIGLPATILQAVNATRRGGTTTVVGAARFDATVELSALRLFLDGKALLGCVNGSAQVRRDFPRFIRLIETGRLDVDAMVSRRIVLDEVNDAFRAMEAGEVIRSVIY